VIHLGPRPPEPAYLNSASVKEAEEEIRSIIENGDVLKSSDFPSYLWRNDHVRFPLYKYQNKKCCYCERKRTLSREFDVEHFRPKSEVKDEDHPGYWWLAFKWDNYFLACKPCNQTHKISHFPLMPDGIRAITPSDGLCDEYPVLINLEKENPAQFFNYKMDWPNTRAYIKGSDDLGRGEENRILLGLNEEPIPEERGEIYAVAHASYIKLVLAIANKNSRLEKIEIKNIKRITSKSARFSGAARYCLEQENINEFLDKPLW